MTVTGLDRLRLKLTRRIPDAVKKRVRDAMEQSANEVVDTMKSLVAVDSGELRDSIAWTWGDAPKGALVLARSSKRSSDSMRITIYAGGGDAFYARFVEFGTQPHVNKGLYAGSHNPGAPAQPFFFPGWRLVKRRVKGRVTRNIRKAIKEAVG